MAERDEATLCFQGREAAEAAPRDVLEEDALDRLLRAEGENLVERRVEGVQSRIIPSPSG